ATSSAATSKARTTASSASSSISTSASHSPSAEKQDRASLFPERCKRISFRIGWISCAPFSPLETPPFTRTQWSVAAVTTKNTQIHHRDTEVTEKRKFKLSLCALCLCGDRFS